MTELKQLRDFAEEVNGVRPPERSLKGVVNNLIGNYSGGVNVVANPELEGLEPNLNSLQVGTEKYVVEGNLIRLIPKYFYSYNEDGSIKNLFVTVEIKNISDNAVNFYFYVKDETTGNIEKTLINNWYTSVKVSGIRYLPEKNNTRYAYKKIELNSTYSQKILSFFVIGAYKYLFEGATEPMPIWYTSHPCYVDIPEIPETTE